MKAEQRILKVLRDYPQDGCWGYDLLRLARVRSGRMYPILARLETEGVVESWWVPKWSSETKLRRRRYRIRQQSWSALNAALNDEDWVDQNVHFSLWTDRGGAR